MTDPRGVRFNNPGNIVSTGTFAGETGKQPDAAFAIFDTPEHGIAAIGTNLRAYQDKHGLNTVRGIISRWSTTDQAAYIKNVAAAVGVGPDDPIDLHDPTIMRAVVLAIIQQENGEQPYSPEQIDSALGIPMTQEPAPIVEEGVPAMSTTVPDSSTPSPFLTLMQGGAAILTAVNPLIGSLASVLINAFAPLAQEKIAAAINKHTDNPAIGQQVAQSLIQGAISLTGKPDPVQATAAAQNDPAILAQLQQMALDHVDKITAALAPLTEVDKSVWAAEQAGKDAASARAKADPWDMTKALVLFAGSTSTVMVLAILAAILWQVVGQGKEPNTALMSLAGPLFMASLVCWKDIFAYRFDGTKDSAAKDVALANLSQK